MIDGLLDLLARTEIAVTYQHHVVAAPELKD
jgi:hypothetical protein